MQTNALGFIFGNDNRQSISALIGAVETNARFDDLDIRLLKPRLGLCQQIESLAVNHSDGKIVVGFSFTTPKALQVLDDVQQIRAHTKSHNLNNVILVAGGPHPTGDWQQTLAIGFDVVVIGEGEKSFPELLTALYNSDNLEHVKGLAYQTGPKSDPVFTGRSARVKNLDDYPPFAERFPLFSSIEITRGCPWACKYCQTTSLFGGRMRHRSVENIVKWVTISKKHDRPEIRFITPDAFAYGSDSKRLPLDALAEMLKSVNKIVGREHTYIGSFPSEVRPESVSGEALELVREFAVNDNILIGAQSGSQRMLDLSHRGNTVEDIYRGVQLVLEAGFIANVDFIFGMPEEIEEDRKATRQMIRDLAAMGARIHSHAFMPLAGTPWANALPGSLDEKTRNLLEHLTGKGQHFGQWRKQQSAARAIADFRDERSNSV
ncbi:MAG: TIGR04013 family B12-binding domain/radical SAM domain-containing protein [Chloroflexi bacterium]|nr:TIGR04013 family B12-binding domain/radical SAM domain-containing protein [Chloroflexota bacterium]